MKLNWGQSLALAMFAFMVFILSYVYKTFTNRSYEHHLVSEEYYKDDQNYQQEIDALANARKLKTNVSIKNTTDGVLVSFPKNISNIEGLINFQRASDIKLDFEIPIKLEFNKLLIPKEKLIAGLYNVKIKWSANNIDYIFKEKFQY